MSSELPTEETVMSPRGPGAVYSGSVPGTAHPYVDRIEEDLSAKKQKQGRCQDLQIMAGTLAFLRPRFGSTHGTASKEYKK